jgi:CO/xanthine dehydrogenase Mo-binding subunit
MTAQITNEDLAKSLSAHSERLAFTATLEGTGEPSVRDGQVRNILARSAEIVRGAAALGRQSNSVALGVLARTVVESLILLLWVEVSEENALHQSNVGFDPADTEFIGGQVRQGGRSVPLAQAARDAELVAEDTMEYGALAKKYAQQTFGAQFVEVAVDAATAEIRIRRKLAVCAAGRISIARRRAAR